MSDIERQNGAAHQPLCELTVTIDARMAAGKLDDRVLERVSDAVANALAGMTIDIEDESVGLQAIGVWAKEKEQIEETFMGWSVKDVYEVRPDLDEIEAETVINTVEHYFDANIGINWNVLSFWADSQYPEHRTLEVALINEKDAPMGNAVLNLATRGLADFNPDASLVRAINAGEVRVTQRHLPTFQGKVTGWQGDKGQHFAVEKDAFMANRARLVEIAEGIDLDIEEE